MSKDVSKEIEFQNDIVAQMQANGRQLGKPELYDRATALYTADVLSFVKGTQPKEWQKFCKVYPQDSDTQFIKHLEEQLKKANPNAIDERATQLWRLGYAEELHQLQGGRQTCPVAASGGRRSRQQKGQGKELSLNNFHISRRYPPPAARKGQTVCAFAGSGRRVAPLRMWKLFLDNS